MLHQKELLILSNLRKDSRMSLTNISKRTKIPISTIYDKIKSYKGNIITKHTTIIDFTRLGFNAKANIMIKVNKDKREQAKNHLFNHLNINSVYKISNGFDFLIEGIFKNVKDVEDFIENFESNFDIENIKVFYVVEDIKKETFLNNGQLLDIVI